MNQPVRPTDGHGQRFHTTNPLAIVAWLQSEGFTLALDTPGMVELALDDELIRICADGTISPIGERADRAARRLLLNSEEAS